MKLKSLTVCFLVFISFTVAADEDFDDYAEEAEVAFEESPFYKDEMEGLFDPLEPFNRLMFKMNNAVDKVVITPLALTYKHVIPKFLQCGIENFASNFFSPLRAINFVFQGNSEHATKAVFRFMINTIFGFFGTVDVAEKIGLTKKDTSFNDTLKKWGAGSGPYLVLPLFGPTSLRGGISKAMTLPVDHIAEISLSHYKKNTRKRLYYCIYGADLLSKRTEILPLMNELEETSEDMYVTIRNAVMAREN
ncbi:MAG: VacJ family lipoprotein [Holosporales bacterium]|nr:VacJ family lipoprotein [Holosporales bacterium]